MATKEQFLLDAPQIEDIVKKAVFDKLNINVGNSEYSSWRNSLGNAMFHVINDQAIPSDAGIAIEYRLNGRRFRIDFMIAGSDAAGLARVIIIELKQWTEVQESPTAKRVHRAVSRYLRNLSHGFSK